MFEIECDVAGGMKARLGILFQAMLHDAFQRRRNIAIGFAQVRRVFLQDRAHRVGGGFAMKRPLAGKHFVEDCSEGENVGARINRHAAHLLRGHVARRPQYHARFRVVGCRRKRSMFTGVGLGQFGQAEIQNLEAPVFREEQIFRLEVAMDDSFFVGCSKSTRDLQSVVQRLAHRNRPAAQALAQSFALKQFRNCVRRSFAYADVEYRQNVGMIQGRGGEGLLLKAMQPVGIDRNGLRQDLDGHFPFKPRVTGTINLTHTARAQ